MWGTENEESFSAAVSTQKSQIVHHEVNRACTRNRDFLSRCFPVDCPPFFALFSLGDLRNDTFLLLPSPHCAPAEAAPAVPRYRPKQYAAPFSLSTSGLLFYHARAPRRPGGGGRRRRRVADATSTDGAHKMRNGIIERCRAVASKVPRERLASSVQPAM